MKMSGKERRVHPRLYSKMPLNVVANGYDFETSTMNVSCLGAYCHIDKYVPPFTKVKIKLELPTPLDNVVECHGVIVRTEDETKGGFNVAIFFNHINEACKSRIAKYISGNVSGSVNPCLR